MYHNYIIILQEQLYDLVKVAQRLSTRMYKTRAPLLREGFGNHFGNGYLIQESHQSTYWEPMKCPEKEIASVTVSKIDLHNLKQVTFTSVLGVVNNSTHNVIPQNFQLLV